MPAENIATTREAAKYGRRERLDHDLIQTLANAVRTIQRLDIVACHVGVDRVTLSQWLKHGARLEAAINHRQGIKPRNLDTDPLTEHDALCLELCIAVNKAQADTAVLIAAGVLSLGTTRHTEKRVTKRYDNAGNEIGRDETTVEKPPDLKALTWFGEHRFPDIFTPPSRVEISGPDGEPIPIEVRANAAAERLREMQQRGELVIHADVDDAEVVHSESDGSFVIDGI